MGDPRNDPNWNDLDEATKSDLMKLHNLQKAPAESPYEVEVEYPLSFIIPIAEGDDDSPEALGERWADMAHEWLSDGGVPATDALRVTIKPATETGE